MDHQVQPLMVGQQLGVARDFMKTDSREGPSIETNELEKIKSLN